MHILDHLGHIFDMLAVVLPALWWLRKWLRKIEMSVGFSKDVATTHLPHVYYRLRRSDDALKLPVVEHPSIVWLNGGNGGVSPSNGKSDIT
jgi:hypothetical protein